MILLKQEIEIEFKAMLTKEKFELLERELAFPKKPITQTNHYFDTKDFYLRHKRCSVRLREIDEEYTFTLKQAKENHVLESNKKLAFNDSNALLQGHYRKIDDVEETLQSVGISGGDLIYYGALKTERKHFSEGQIIYFLDKSFYNGKKDFELEIEAPTYKLGLKVFQDILKKYNITPSRPMTKIERFFQSMLD